MRCSLLNGNLTEADIGFFHHLQFVLPVDVCLGKRFLG